MGNTRNTQTQATAPAQNEKEAAIQPGITIEKTAYTQEEIESLFQTKQETEKKLKESEDVRIQQDQTIATLKDMLKEASKDSVKVVVAEGNIVVYNGKTYQASQASYWFKGFSRPVYYKNLTDAQKAELLENNKLVEVE